MVPHGSRKGSPHARARSGALAAFNSLYVGGFLHVLYQCYSPVVSAVATRMAASGSALHLTASPQHALGCAVVDNLHCGSLYIPAFFACVGTMQGQTLGEVWRASLVPRLSLRPFPAAAPALTAPALPGKALALLQGEWWPTYTSCTAFWIPFMAANFRMVAPARRVQAMAVANMFWNVVIDYLAHRQLHAPPSPDRPALLFRTEQPKTVVWPLC